MFSCEFYEISKNTFFTEHLLTTASLLLDPFKDFRFNSPHPQVSKAGSSWLMKDYTDEDFCRVI